MHIWRERLGGASQHARRLGGTGLLIGKVSVVYLCALARKVAVAWHVIRKIGGDRLLGGKMNVTEQVTRKVELPNSWSASSLIEHM